MKTTQSDLTFFKQVEEEIWAAKYERLEYLKNKIENCTIQAATLPVENSAYLKAELLPGLKNEYYKLFLELRKKEKSTDEA